MKRLLFRLALVASVTVSVASVSGCRKEIQEAKASHAPVAVAAFAGS